MKKKKNYETYENTAQQIHRNQNKLLLFLNTVEMKERY